jgi:hypothetical protein
LGNNWVSLEETEGDNIGLESLIIFCAAVDTDFSLIVGRELNRVELEKYSTTCSIYGISDSYLSEESELSSECWNYISSCELEVGPQEGPQEGSQEFKIESQEFKPDTRLGIYESLLLDIEKQLTESFDRFDGYLTDKEGLVCSEYVLVRLSKL